MANSQFVCWVCAKNDFDPYKPSDVTARPSSTDFAITNFNYGKTGELRQCRACGFIQCVDLDAVIGFYENLQDEEYENTRKERKLQEARLVQYLKQFKAGGSLLDIGAGSGIMVEAALEKGYRAVGIEPSKWLQQRAVERGLPIVQGVFPHSDIQGTFDIVTLVDVLEHVISPATLLDEIHRVLNGDGVLVLVTPDVSSIAARLLKFKWWHFRLAHVGYFDRNNLSLLLEKQGFDVLRIKRPSWYFTLRYLGVRLLSFLPRVLRFPLPRILDKIIVPLNVRDSMLVVCRKAGQQAQMEH
jgi:SAM-dependent methyltransferase